MSHPLAPKPFLQRGRKYTWNGVRHCYPWFMASCLTAWHILGNSSGYQVSQNQMTPGTNSSRGVICSLGLPQSYFRLRTFQITHVTSASKDGVRQKWKLLYNLEWWWNWLTKRWEISSPGCISEKHRAEVTHSLELIKHCPARAPREQSHSQD